MPHSVKTFQGLVPHKMLTQPMAITYQAEKLRPTAHVRIFDFSKVVAEVNHFSVGGVFGAVKVFSFFAGLWPCAPPCCGA
jgi:hypothetical protein